MKPSLPILAATFLLAHSCISAAFAQSGGNFNLSWSSIDGGGGTSTGGVFTVSGTIGQPDAGTLSGGTFSLNGGFRGIIAAIPTPGAPPLAVRLVAADRVIIAWPNPSTGFELQENTNLGTTNWVNMATPPQVVGDEKQISVSPPTGYRFFRLRSP